LSDTNDGNRLRATNHTLPQMAARHVPARSAHVGAAACRCRSSARKTVYDLLGSGAAINFHCGAVEPISDLSLVALFTSAAFSSRGFPHFPRLRPLRQRMLGGWRRLANVGNLKVLSSGDRLGLVLIAVPLDDLLSRLKIRAPARPPPARNQSGGSNGRQPVLLGAAPSTSRRWSSH